MLRNRETSGRHVYVIDMEREMPIASIVVPRVPGDEASSPAVEALVAEYTEARLRRAATESGRSESDFAIWVGEDVGGAFRVTVTAEPATLVRALTVFSTLVDAPRVDPAVLAEARHAVEERIRNTRVAPMQVPATVQGWLSQGRRVDPRIELWSTLGGVTAEAMEKWLARARTRPMFVIVSGASDQVAPASLEAIGELHVLKLPAGRPLR